MTPRVREALLDILSNPPKRAFRKLRSGENPSDQLVFGISDNVRTAWTGALKDASLAHLGLHFHDLRHTPGTRVREILALPVIQKALGHKDPKLTAEIYINDSEGDISKFAQAIRRVVEEGQAQLLLEENPETEIDQESDLIR